ncbi:MAG TPA: response regulator transcription factor [Candidatus Methylomirabilis sp.]|nr:response regulator transcription factor [Candidatus Methylomirabilis sp.]
MTDDHRGSDLWEEGRPLRILLADDHEIVRQHVRAILEEAGFEVAGETSDGRQAVRLARRLRPDLVILDVSMPRLNGFRAAEEILGHAPQTRVILLTVHAERGYVRRAIQLGICGYVVKTQMPDDLVAAIQEVARGRTYQSHILSETAVPV